MADRVALSVQVRQDQQITVLFCYQETIRYLYFVYFKLYVYFELYVDLFTMSGARQAQSPHLEHCFLNLTGDGISWPLVPISAECTVYIENFSKILSGIY